MTAAFIAEASGRKVALPPCPIFDQLFPPVRRRSGRVATLLIVRRKNTPILPLGKAGRIV
jgi:hypothetical protein